jgi:hypothetical protein
MKLDTNPALFGDEQNLLVNNLSLLPHKILQNYHLASLSQIILHELGHSNCFGFEKAVYLIDNPDFDHMVGVAGFNKCECKHHKEDLWADPKSFDEDMKEATFHNDAKKIISNSLKLKNLSLDDALDIKEIGRSLGMKNPDFFSWHMKHDNHGILIFEPNKSLCAWRRGLLANAVALLSL